LIDGKIQDVNSSANTAKVIRISLPVRQGRAASKPTGKTRMTLTRNYEDEGRNYALGRQGRTGGWIRDHCCATAREREAECHPGLLAVRATSQ
jgi:hypothetical protein